MIGTYKIIAPKLFTPGIIIGVFIAFSSCYSPPANRVIAVQPFSDIPAKNINELYASLKQIAPHIILRKPIQLPSSVYYQQRGRYRADSVINYLNHFGSADTVVIGLTTRDISTTKGNTADWGIMGLGFEPGNACAISTFRLLKSDQPQQFYKLALHELGHTQGLPHCPNKTCFMRDAEGRNHFNEETDFCPKCKSYLKHKGWQLK